ncbi:hypothetical protein KIKIMORA_05110 [Brevundimonas phage vB_BpoS-Kikimora]|uniref:Uncharacterized protein n=1 Tax=Brevundimonas phage vB_BpoS-Kikimora TaxID=2948601 RepID=A0A9E7MSG5_9CAUD|nr:hypothetical protein KIKIMORA_05110 [Brevundimonas phage vB_BpoS-Kikimora]
MTRTALTLTNRYLRMRRRCCLNSGPGPPGGAAPIRCECVAGGLASSGPRPLGAKPNRVESSRRRIETTSSQVWHQRNETRARQIGLASNFAPVESRGRQVALKRARVESIGRQVARPGVEAGGRQVDPARRNPLASSRGVEDAERGSDARRRPARRTARRPAPGQYTPSTPHRDPDRRRCQARGHRRAIVQVRNGRDGAQSG